MAAPRKLGPETLRGLGEAILDALPLSLYVVDRELRVVAWNRRREEGPLGRPRRDVLGRKLSEVLPAAGYRATEPILRRVFLSGLANMGTHESQRGSRLFRVARVPVLERGRVSHVVSNFEDVTDQRGLEMRVIASDRLAFLGQLVAGAAHEIANPLAAIAGCAEALAGIARSVPEAAAREEARQFHEMIREEVARCERILSTLLESARPSRAEVAVVSEIVTAVMRLLERHPGFARVRFATRIPPDLPPVRLEADSLKQVVIALATNAARAMAGEGTLSLRAGRLDGRVRLDVVDTGPGVPKNVLPHIFEPYFTTHPGQGAGLGLAIARSLVRGRGGDLLYRRRKGPGAAFRILLPCAEERP